MSIEMLYDTIKYHEVDKLNELLKQGVNPNIYPKDSFSTPLGEAIYEYDHDDGMGRIDEFGNIGFYEKGSLELANMLLQYNANINSIYSEVCGALEMAIMRDKNSKFYIKLIELLLTAGANPNKYYDMREYPLKLDTEEELELTMLLLKYGALYNDAENYDTRFPRFNELQNATLNGRIKEIKLLLDYGADTMSIDEDGYMINYGNCKDMVLDDIKLTIEECQELLDLLNPNNPPYLKLGESDEDKYIIYVNKLIEPEGYLPHPLPYLLVDKQKYKDKRYLYADNKIDVFVYWCYTKNLLSENVISVVELYKDKLGEINYKNINIFITTIIGNKVSTDIFNEEGKVFARAYLTVTHWWYNLHTEFNRLYQDENNRLPRAIKSQEEFDTLMKLLDIRYEQFISGKDFNSNQNKAELEALIEGRETPKRVLDLSWLEEDNNGEYSGDNDNYTFNY